MAVELSLEDNINSYAMHKEYTVDDDEIREFLVQEYIRILYIHTYGEYTPPREGFLLE